MTSSHDHLPSFVLDPHRYRLYVAMSCPFAHRVRMVRLLHGLEASFELSFVTGQTSESFTFDTPEPEFAVLTLKEIYAKAAPASYEGRYTVPLIVDKTTKKMVNNESLEMSFALATQCADDALNLLPSEAAKELCQELNGKVTVAVYRYLFAPTEAKEGIKQMLWAELDKYNTLLGSQEYLLGGSLPTLPDLILWATVIRFDNAYARQFGIQGKTIKSDYPHLMEFAKRVWNLPSKRGDTTLGQDADLSEVIRMYWQSGNLAPKAGNDPTAPVPVVLPVF